MTDVLIQESRTILEKWEAAPALQERILASMRSWIETNNTGAVSPSLAYKAAAMYRQFVSDAGEEK